MMEHKEKKKMTKKDRKEIAEEATSELDSIKNWKCRYCNEKGGFISDRIRILKTSRDNIHWWLKCKWCGRVQDVWVVGFRQGRKISK